MIRAFIRRHIIADDPNPEYSRLDRRDGLYDDEEAFKALATRMFPGSDK